MGTEGPDPGDVARILVDSGILTPEQAAAAEAGREAGRESFCAALVRLGAFEGEDLVRALTSLDTARDGRRNGGEILEVDGVRLRADLVRLMPESPARPPAVLPLYRAGGLLFAAVSGRPPLGDLESRLGVSVEPVPVRAIDVPGILVKAQQLLRRQAPSAEGTAGSAGAPRARGAAGLSLPDLGWPPDVVRSFRRAFAEPQGLFLITGPHRSGKADALRAVEAELQGQKFRVASQEGVTGAAGLEEALRDDPDAVTIDGLDGEALTVTAVRAAVSGCRVIAAIRAPDAAGAIARLLGAKADPHLVASALRAVLTLRRVPGICPGCATEFREDPEVLEDLRLEGVLDGVALRRGRGCSECGGSGARGREALVEYGEPGGKFRELVASAADEAKLRAAPFRAGFRSLAADGLEKVKAGRITLADFREAVPYLQILQLGATL